MTITWSLAFSGEMVRGGVHERVVTGGGPQAAKHSKRAAVNAVLANLKTAIDGSCHAFDFSEYASRYLADVPLPIKHRYRLVQMLATTLGSIARAAQRIWALRRESEVG